MKKIPGVNIRAQGMVRLFCLDLFSIALLFIHPNFGFIIILSEFVNQSVFKKIKFVIDYKVLNTKNDTISYNFSEEFK